MYIAEPEQLDSHGKIPAAASSFSYALLEIHVPILLHDSSLAVYIRTEVGWCLNGGSCPPWHDMLWGSLVIYTLMLMMTMDLIFTVDYEYG